MDVLWAGGNMKGYRFKTPVSLILLLLLGIGLRHTVLCQQEDSADPEPETLEEEIEEVEAKALEIVTDEQTSDPAEDDLSTTPTPTTSNATDTDFGEKHGSGENATKTRSIDLGEEPSDSTDQNPEATEETVDGIDLMVIIIPAVLVVLLIAIIVCVIFIHRKLNGQTRHSEVSKEDPYLEGSSTEKVPMPMFEEDVPSVLELEMDELDDWMKKDGETADSSKQA